VQEDPATSRAGRTRKRPPGTSPLDEGLKRLDSSMTRCTHEAGTKKAMHGGSTLGEAKKLTALVSSRSPA